MAFNFRDCILSLKDPRAMLVTEKLGGLGPQMKLFSTSYFILFLSHVS